MPAIYQHPYIVLPEDTDGVGHVNNLSYMKWMQDAAIAHASAQGWPPERHLELGSGWVVRSHFIEYLRPAFPGDHIVVNTWVSGFSRITSVRKYQIVRAADDTLLARAETNWVYIKYDSHTPRRIPPEVSESFQIVPLDQEPLI
jgi:acyl-CoA thioester hydrolase